MSPEERLLASEISYRHLFNAVADAIFTLDPVTGLIIDANRNAQTLYGWSAAELRGMPMRALSAEPEKTEASVAEALKSGRVHATRRHKRRDGSVFYAEIHASTLENEGRVTAIAAIRDISEMTLEREKLEASERRFRQMAESISQVFWMTDLSMNHIVYISPGYETIWGRTCMDLYANPRAWLDAIVPEDRARVLLAATSAPSTGRYEEIYRIRRPDGAIRWIHDKGYPVKDDSGAMIKIAGVARDVTEQREAEEALLESRSLLEQAQEVARAGSWVYSIQTDSVVWSRECCRILGVEYGPTRRVADFVAVLHSDDRERVRTEIAACLELGKPYELEYRVTVEGAVRLILSRATIVRGTDGRALKMIGVVRDVTEEREKSARLESTELQLRQAQKMEAVGRLAGGVAHDFNNILTAILGFTEISIAALPADCPVRADLTEVRASTLRAANLTHQLLAFSRRQPITPRIVDLDDAIQGVAKMLKRIIGEDVELIVEAESAASVLVDPGQLEQLAANLSVNARDAMPDGGRLTISTATVVLDAETAAKHEGLAAGRYAALVVSDSGSGMSPEVQSHLFEPFFTTKALGKGTGLGLATCYGIARQNGGTISCDSALGRGTTFTVYLPLHTGKREQEKEGREPLPRGGRERILVVEDEKPVRELVTRILGGLGYDVVQASNGVEALGVLRDDAGSAVRLGITDMVMPELGGKKLSGLVAGFRPDIRMLFTSGYTDDMIGGGGTLESGMDFLSKPFSSAELATRVRRALDA